MFKIKLKLRTETEPKVSVGNIYEVYGTTYEVTKVANMQISEGRFELVAFGVYINGGSYEQPLFYLNDRGSPLYGQHIKLIRYGSEI